MQTDALAASACILSIAVYHAVHLFRVLRKPNSTVFGRASASRVRWVKFIASQKKDVLAVQTLRNLIMVSSIMASTCVVLIFGFISFFSSLPSSTPQNFVLENHTLSTLFGIRVDGTFASKVCSFTVAR
ncbi:hypothetical protein BC830DRAFT_1175896 [Chytriomyces sp. MP71]|nr:hypothetical protein BC830DRAFT_1175896 [Chytriomyces sp. MP71]